MTRLRVLLADDHIIVAEGLRSLLEPEFELVAIVDDGQQLIEHAIKLEPDLIVADITILVMNGLEAIERLKAENCSAKIIILTMHKDLTYAARALRAGASGFVLKHSASTELLTALQTVINGQTYVTPEVADKLSHASMQGSLESDSLTELTPRQREVLQIFAEGRSAKQVAHKLHISRRTAENHKARVMETLGLTTTTELIQYAIRHGIVGE